MNLLAFQSAYRPQQAQARDNMEISKRANTQLAPHANSAVVVLVIFLVLTLIFTALRFYSRWVTRRRFFAADWVLLAAEVGYGSHDGQQLCADADLAILYHLYRRILCLIDSGRCWTPSGRFGARPDNTHLQTSHRHSDNLRGVHGASENQCLSSLYPHIPAYVD